MNKTDKIREGHIQIDNKHNYRPLSEPMVKEMHTKVLRLITDLQHENHNGNRNMRELNKLSVVHFKGSAQLTQFPPLLNINCTEVYLGPLYRSYIIIEIFNCKIPERVLLNGAICKRVSKVSHRGRCAACHLLQVFTSVLSRQCPALPVKQHKITTNLFMGSTPL